MRGRLLLVLLWCSGTLTPVAGQTAIRCFSDFFRNISCDLDVGDGPRPDGRSLKFKGTRDQSYGASVSCPLVLMGDGYRCDCQVMTPPLYMSRHEKYNVSLCSEDDCHVVMKDFYPCNNIQLTPPEFTLGQINDSLWITWQTKRFDNDYLENNLLYKFKLQDSEGHERNLSTPSQGSESMQIDVSLLKADTEYCVIAAYKTEIYPSIWSQWTEPKCQIIKAKEDLSEPENMSIFWAKSLSPVCIAGVVLFLVFNCPATRMKIKTITHMPSPAPFFQPLFQQHKGNIQEWISPHGKFVLTYKAEEDVITNAVTVVPKPITKDPEEYQGFNNPPVTHLVFPQNLSSYVGLPEVHKSPLPTTVVNVEDTPYTQLPCPLWGFDISQIQATSVPPEDFLDISKTDSGCSCEDLSQSPECSLPSSPVDEIPLPHFCNDYCILNKTAEGVVPVLVSKESSGKILSDSWDEDELK